jgi:hypothetical protein
MVILLSEHFPDMMEPSDHLRKCGKTKRRARTDLIRSKSALDSTFDARIGGLSANDQKMMVKFGKSMRKTR